MAAKLPSGTVSYHLRHAAISELIANRVAPFTVARMAGTSTAMIDKHYGHLIHGRAREILDSVKVI